MVRSSARSGPWIMRCSSATLPPSVAESFALAAAVEDAAAGATAGKGAGTAGWDSTAPAVPALPVAPLSAGAVCAQPACTPPIVNIATSAICRSFDFWSM
ncbi:protein of unknown function [Paraburkholderia kururiensis]